MSVYAYARVSTDRQADEGESLGAQQRQIAGYAQMIDLAIDHTFVERGVSGSKPLADRPQAAQLLARVQPGDTIIASKLDRLFRSALDALAVLSDLKARGVALHLIDLGGDLTGNGIAKLVFTILSAVAEAERDRIRERICDVKRDQHARGRYLGGTVPFGFTVGPAGELVEAPEQQTATRSMIELRQQGLSLRAIAAQVEARHGIKVSHAGVSNALRAHGRACPPADPPLTVAVREEAAFAADGSVTVRATKEAAWPRT
jgi:DNA invertase Pin-like site-specific DNA recombinase